MQRTKLELLLLCLLGGAVLGGAVLAGTPSPARVQFDGFLAAFNSGDRATITAFGKDHAPPDFLRPAIVDQTLEMSRTSGGYDVLEVYEIDSLSVKSWVLARATKNVVELTIVVDPANPERITVITLNDAIAQTSPPTTPDR
jgi:hypothetical protein